MGKDKKEYQIGTFSDSLGTGLANILSEDKIEIARKIVADDIKAIRQDVLEQINRLGELLKDEVGAIPRTEDLADWMFDKKKIWETGNTIPKITDKEIIQYAKEYVASLKMMIHQSGKPVKGELQVFQWSGPQEQLTALYNRLIMDGFIGSKTSLEAFSAIFSGCDISNIKEKIIWLKRGLNKRLNKKSISDFIDVLKENNLIVPISTPSHLLSILSISFRGIDSETKFTHSNLVKEESYSGYRMDFEKIATTLIM